MVMDDILEEDGKENMVMDDILDNANLTVWDDGGDVDAEELEDVDIEEDVDTHVEDDEENQNHVSRSFADRDIH
jgi:hypothetical protein